MAKKQTHCHDLERAWARSSLNMERICTHFQLQLQPTPDNSHQPDNRRRFPKISPNESYDIKGV
ncbi:hypothetical protein C0J52_12447 [Blattella germanica]|nr:hypothetical protein C0J52_12447 [Blattella germanica]